MNARWIRLTGLVVAGALGVACAEQSPERAVDPDLADSGSEASVAVTVPSGPETLPTWERNAPQGTATLVVPADLLFSKDGADLGPEAVTVLAQVTDELAGLDAKVLVEGFADEDGDAQHNQDLSERRAASVARWLTVNGVDPSTITTRGWGETRPVAQEIDEAAKSQNRRVVVTIAQREGIR